MLIIVFFQPIYDEIEDLLYAKRSQNVLKFVSSETLEQQIEEEFLNEFASLDTQDEYYETIKKPF